MPLVGRAVNRRPTCHQHNQRRIVAGLRHGPDQRAPQFGRWAVPVKALQQRHRPGELALQQIKGGQRLIKSGTAAAQLARQLKFDCGPPGVAKGQQQLAVFTAQIRIHRVQLDGHLILAEGPAAAIEFEQRRPQVAMMGSLARVLPNDIFEVGQGRVRPAIQKQDQAKSALDLPAPDRDLAQAKPQRFGQGQGLPRLIDLQQAVHRRQARARRLAVRRAPVNRLGAPAQSRPRRQDQRQGEGGPTPAGPPARSPPVTPCRPQTQPPRR
jgi:hypothetical protein